MHSCCSDAAAAKKTLTLTTKQLKVLAEPSRLRLLCLLKCGASRAGYLSQHLNQPQNLTSHHLAVLRRAGLVKNYRRGLIVHYQLNRPAVAGLVEQISRLLTNETKSCKRSLSTTVK